MATEADGAGGSAEAVGMPQLDFSTYPNQIFWLVIALLALYWLLSRRALPLIGGILTDRRGAIESDLARAEELKEKAAEAEKAYETALADARADAQRIIADAKAEMKTELDEATRQAEAQIEEKMKQSEARIDEIRQNATTAAAEVAHEIAGDLTAALGHRAEEGELTAAIDAQLERRAS